MATRDSLQQPTWTAVDDYLTDLLLGSDPALEAARAASAAAGLPDIAVSPPQGKLLFLLARLRERAPSSRSAPWEATAPSGWRARCRRAVA